MNNFTTPLKSIPRITPKYQKLLEKIGLLTVQDLLLYLPFRYDDFRNLAPISEEYIGKMITVEAQIKKVQLKRIWKRKMTIVEILVQDEAGTEMKAVWFNQPFIMDSLRIGTNVRLSGKLALTGKKFSMSAPSWERATREETNTGRLIPVYPETKGLSSKWLRWQIKEFMPLLESMSDPVPQEILEKYNLYDLPTALTQLHFPDSKEKLVRAQKRMAFQEMFLVQLQAQKIKRDWAGKKSLKISFNEKLVKDFVKNLPFALTDAQRKAAFEILKDLEKPMPMNRLLNGDVGAGKTVVAAIASLETVSAGFQVALMAPTEVLARQHLESFSKLFKDYKINIALLTSSYKLVASHPLRHSGLAATRDKLLKNISAGKINLIIGTHALIQKDVKFKNLALVIIDEQHRFGVNQRAALQQNIPRGSATRARESAQQMPHLLTMTATPIPRTLAIAFFGSLDLSILDEMPKNRRPIETKIILPDGREKIYAFIESEVKKGRQAFVILPLVTESVSEMMVDVKAATVEHKRMAEKIFPDMKLGLLHGKMKAKEKEEVMRKFKDKELDILVSTSVVEVGIDIPNATVMIIENAERFGLSQLHQFRGRVGRGIHQSYCFLFSEKQATRLKTMEKTNDGFEISEADLKLRGAGQFLGTIQSGTPDIAMENLNNIKLIKFAKADAEEILTGDPELKKHPLLANALKKFSNKIHLE